jgi:hypothetical protein
MRVRGLRLLLGLAGVAVLGGGSAVLHARQQAAGSVLPGKFIVINKGPAESIPVTLTMIDAKLPTVPVVVMAATDTELGERTLLRLAPKRVLWEYDVVTVPEADIEVRLNAAGREGWELVNVISSAKTQTLVLKRPR